ncbi:MAG TPA: hypothetical protein VLW85_05355 [Myxococcales bacterium]|nr:hypothetical protein [Myxococcales bacterium]
MWQGLWVIAPVLGGYLGFGFVGGELPNSFLKRQLDVAPGGRRRAPGHQRRRPRPRARKTWI